MLGQIRRLIRRDTGGLTRAQIALYRDFLSNAVLMHGVAAVSRPRPFEGLAWHYYLADVDLEARAARIPVPDLADAWSISETIKALPPMGIVRLMAAHVVYFSPADNEPQIDESLQRLDAATVQRMRQRQQAILADNAAAAKANDARTAAAAQDAELEAQWRRCPHATLSCAPEDFLPWVKLQSPDTWHVLVAGWDYNSADRDDVIEWILDQPSCDLATAAQYFFSTAIGLATEDPEKLSPGYRRKWLLMKRVADNWQRGLYARNELQHSVEPSDIAWYDELVARREAEGRPLPWKLSGPDERRFGGRLPDSAYCYEPGHLTLNFAAWKRHRERLGCGRDFPRCCEA